MNYMIAHIIINCFQIRHLHTKTNYLNVHNSDTAHFYTKTTITPKQDLQKNHQDSNVSMMADYDFVLCAYYVSHCI